MGMATAGTVPSVLKKRVILAIVRLFDDEIYNKFPVQGLFGPPVLYGESEFVIHLRKTLRKLGTEWASGPTGADPEALHTFTKRVMSALYLSKIFRIPPGAINALLGFEQIGQTQMLPAQFAAIQAQHTRLIAEGIEDLALFIRRQLEKLCINVLNNTSFSITIDGVSQTFTTGLGAANAKTAGASWATASTDILEEWAEWMLAFKRLAGGAPTHILLPPNFYADYVLPNTDVRDFLIRNPALVNADTKRIISDAGGQDPSERGQVVMTIDDQYSDDGSTNSDMWPEGKMVWVRDPEMSLTMATVATEDNDWNGGLYSYTFQEQNPRTTCAVVNFNGLPIVKDPNKVMHFDLTP